MTILTETIRPSAQSEITDRQILAETWKESALTVPEVSIITPVYNGDKYIESAVKSVFSQTFDNFEWIIIDDSSTDRTHEVLTDVETRDGRIRVFRLDRNRGPIHARNAGFEQARGRYIAFLDIDDNWLPEKLEKQIRFMKEKGAALSYTGYRKFSDEGEVTSRFVIPVPARITSQSMKKTCSIMASSAIFDTEKTGRLLQDITAPQKDDLHLWVRILDKAGYGYGLKEDLARLRIHSDSFTGNKLKEAKKQWIFYRVSMDMPVHKTIFYFLHYAVMGTIKYML